MIILPPTRRRRHAILATRYLSYLIIGALMVLTLAFAAKALFMVWESM